MTQREFLERVINGKVDKEVVDKAKELVANLDHRNANRKVSKAELAKRKANEELGEKFLEFLNGKEVVTAKEFAEQFELSTQKASSIARMLEKADKVKVSEVIINKRVVKGYSL